MNNRTRIALLLILSLLTWTVSANSTYEFETPESVYVVADIHGAYDEIHTTLKTHNIIDEKDNWSAGTSHFISLGDLIDRGPSSRKILELFMKLQIEAEKAGGRFHIVLGNHEIMNLTGDLRYVSPEEYAEFAIDEDSAERQKYFDRFLKEQKLTDTPEVKASFQKRFPKGYFAHRAAYSNEGRYGQWLVNLPFVIKVNSEIFVHGGLSNSLQGKSLVAINTELKQTLIDYMEAAKQLKTTAILSLDDDFKGSLKKVKSLADSPMNQKFLKLRQSLLFKNTSPTWYRGTALCHPYFEEEILQANLKQWDANRVWVGHTTTPNREVQDRFGGQLVMLDTGMLKAHYKGDPWLAKIENDKPLTFMHGVSGKLSKPVKAPAREEANPLGMTDQQVEEFLRTAEVVSRKATKEGRTKPYKVTLKQGDKVLKGIFKYTNISGSKGRGRIKKRGPADRFTHEIAAYKLDRLLGIGLVPVTVEREIGGKRGSLQLWIDDLISDLSLNANNIGYLGYCDAYSQVNLMNNFDYLIMNNDRNQSNIMYSQSDGQIWFIDHSRSFSTTKKRPKILAGSKIVVPAPLKKELEKLNEEALKSLSPWLSDKQRRAILERRDRLLVGDF